MFGRVHAAHLHHVRKPSIDYRQRHWNIINGCNPKIAAINHLFDVVVGAAFNVGAGWGYESFDFVVDAPLNDQIKIFQLCTAARHAVIFFSNKFFQIKFE